jgi:biopolymer transport protein ExbB
MAEFLGHWMTHLIVGVALVHGVAYAVLIRRAGQQRRLLIAWLEKIVMMFRSSSVPTGRSVDEQVDVFIADVRDVLNDESRSADQALLRDRLGVKDEDRPYIGRQTENLYNVLRAGCEAYPLLGILGTILSMAGAFQSGGDEGSGGADAAAQAIQTIGSITEAFQGAIWSTAAGLVFGLVFLMVNASTEESLSTLVDQQRHVYETIREAKNQLGLRVDRP